jgi:hypothetical protein
MKSTSTKVTRNARARFSVPDSIFSLQSKQNILLYSRRKIMASKTIKLIKTYLGLLTKSLLGQMENKKIDVYS